MLWDIPEENRAMLTPDFLMGRAVAYGSIPLMLHAKRAYGVDAMRQVISTMKPDSISPRRRAFAEKVLLA